MAGAKFRPAQGPDLPIVLHGKDGMMGIIRMAICDPNVSNPTVHPTAIHCESVIKIVSSSILLSNPEVSLATKKNTITKTFISKSVHSNKKRYNHAKKRMEPSHIQPIFVCISNGALFAAL